MYKNIMNEMLHVSTSLTAKAVKLITVFQYESRLRSCVTSVRCLELQIIYHTFNLIVDYKLHNTVDSPSNIFYLTQKKIKQKDE